jgi:hypothetical protein
LTCWTVEEDSSALLQQEGLDSDKGRPVTVTLGQGERGGGESQCPSWGEGQDGEGVSRAASSAWFACAGRDHPDHYTRSWSPDADPGGAVATVAGGDDGSSWAICLLRLSSEETTQLPVAHHSGESVVGELESSGEEHCRSTFTAWSGCRRSWLEIQAQPRIVAHAHVHVHGRDRQGRMRLPMPRLSPPGRSAACCP